MSSPLCPEADSLRAADRQKAQVRTCILTLPLGPEPQVRGDQQQDYGRDCTFLGEAAAQQRCTVFLLVLLRAKAAPDVHRRHV